MTQRWRVIGTRGCGSILVEAALVLAGFAYDREEVDYAAADSPGGRRLRELNPLGQVPVVIAPDGRVLTESAALVLRIAELAPGSGIAPAASAPERPEFLRWLVWLVAAVYPTFTYGDEPARWVGAEGAPALRASTDAHREQLWRQLEGACGAPWLLGDMFSMLDVYIAVMTHWRPRRAWFDAHCPKLAAIAAAVDRDPRLGVLLAGQFS